MNKKNEYELSVEEYKAKQDVQASVFIVALGVTVGIGSAGAGLAVDYLSKQLPSVTIIGGYEAMLGAIAILSLTFAYSVFITNRFDENKHYWSYMAKRVQEKQRLLEAKLR